MIQFLDRNSYELECWSYLVRLVSNARPSHKENPDKFLDRDNVINNGYRHVQGK
jgi:hypothetical protein